MKQQKNKIIFIATIVCVGMLMVWYYVSVVTGDGNGEQELLQPEVPALEDTRKEYGSKLEAVGDVKEERQITAPSVYAETAIDSTGLYDPDLAEKQRQRLVDSIYRHGRIHYADAPENLDRTSYRGTAKTNKEVEPVLEERDFVPAHAAFFSSNPMVALLTTKSETTATDAFIVVEVNGEQTVRQDERLELRLSVDAKIRGRTVSRNTLIYGFVSFRPNRVQLNITNIDHRIVDLKAYDLLDGNEGLYIENSFRAEAGREVLDDVVQDINVPGLPQVGGIKQVFRRNNRNVKVTVRNQYQLILKGG